MKSLRLLVLTASFIVCPASFCGGVSTINQLTVSTASKGLVRSAFYVAEGVGVAVNHSHSKNIFLPQLPGWSSDQYYVNKQTSAPLFLIELGGQKHFHRHWFAEYRFGLQYSYAADSKFQGGLIQFLDPNFDNYTFDINVVRHSIMVVNQLAVYQWTSVNFFVDVGIGASLNKVVGYQEYPRANITPRVSPNFSSALHSDFSYLVGFGLAYTISTHNQLDVQYRYRDNGRFITGLGSGNFSSDKLSYAQMSNEILVKLVSVFGA